MQRRSFLQSAVGFGLFALLAPALGRAALGATELKLTEADRALVKRVEDYLNGLTTLQARFLQSSSNGSYAEGDIYVERPSRMRFEYDPPVPLLIIAAGSTMATPPRVTGSQPRSSGHASAAWGTNSRMDSSLGITAPSTGHL